MLLGRLLVNSRLLIVKLGWSQKLYVDFWPPTPAQFKGQLCVPVVLKALGFL